MNYIKKPFESFSIQEPKYKRNFLQIYLFTCKLGIVPNNFSVQQVTDSLKLFISAISVQGRCSILMARSFHLVAPPSPRPCCHLHQTWRRGQSSEEVCLLLKDLRAACPTSHIPLARTSYLATPRCRGGWEMSFLTGLSPNQLPPYHNNGKNKLWRTTAFCHAVFGQMNE